MDKTMRKSAAIASVKKLQSQASGADKFEASKEQKAPSSMPAWKNIQPPAGD